jgi:hypothetical protein
MEERDQVSVDYSLPYWHVYRDVFKRLFDKALRKGQLHALFTMFSFHKAEPEVIPSWVPDQSEQRNMVLSIGRPLYSNSQECFRSTKELRWTNDGDTLMLQGILVDVVYHASALPEWDGTGFLLGV